MGASSRAGWEERELLPAMQPVEAEAAMQLHAIVGYRNTVQAQGLLVNRSARSIATQAQSITGSQTRRVGRSQG